MTTDLNVQLHSSGLDVLCDIIIGWNVQIDDGGLNLPYRRLCDIENFFTDIGIKVVEADSRAKTARATLSSINSTPQLKTCIESALLPAYFVSMVNPYEASDALLPHLEATGWSLHSSKKRTEVVLDGGEVFSSQSAKDSTSVETRIFPSSIDDLLRTIIRGLPRAIYPLSKRRKNLNTLKFDNEYDVQDLLHSHLRPWIADIRDEEFTPSYAGSSTRMDFLLPKYSTVIETKIVRDSSHAKKVGEELILDIAHYTVHPDCKILWCVIYDPKFHLANPDGLINDLKGRKESSKRSIEVIVEIIPAAISTP